MLNNHLFTVSCFCNQQCKRSKASVVLSITKPRLCSFVGGNKLVKGNVELKKNLIEQSWKKKKKKIKSDETFKTLGRLQIELHEVPALSQEAQKWKLQWEVWAEKLLKNYYFSLSAFALMETAVSQLRPLPAKDAEYYSHGCTGVSASPELCHFGFRKRGLWRGYVLIWCIRGSLYRGSCLSRLIQDFLLLIYQGYLWWHVAAEIKVSELIELFRVSEYVYILDSTLCIHLSAVVVAGGAGLLGVVGDGCSCFSMVSFTNSCS